MAPVFEQHQYTFPLFFDPKKDDHIGKVKVLHVHVYFDMKLQIPIWIFEMM
jgi:hypothetical protein